MRDDDIRQAIKMSLQASKAFDGVYLSGLPEDYGQAAGDLRACAIEPAGSTEIDAHDDGVTGLLDITSQVRLTFLVRNDDAIVRDRACEKLVNVAQNALNYNAINAALGQQFVLPTFTRALNWTWQKPKPPERRIVTIFRYRYLVQGWNSLDTTD